MSYNSPSARNPARETELMKRFCVLNVTGAILDFLSALIACDQFHCVPRTPVPWGTAEKDIVLAVLTGAQALPTNTQRPETKELPQRRYPGTVPGRGKHGWSRGLWGFSTFHTGRGQGDGRYFRWVHHLGASFGRPELSRGPQSDGQGALCLEDLESELPWSESRHHCPLSEWVTASSHPAVLSVLNRSPALGF